MLTYRFAFDSYVRFLFDFGVTAEVARAFVYPDPAPYDDAVLLWASRVDFKLPPPPRVESHSAPTMAPR